MAILDFRMGRIVIFSCHRANSNIPWSGCLQDFIAVHFFQLTLDAEACTSSDVIQRWLVNQNPRNQSNSFHIRLIPVPVCWNNGH